MRAGPIWLAAAVASRASAPSVPTQPCRQGQGGAARNSHNHCIGGGMPTREHEHACLPAYAAAGQRQQQRQQQRRRRQQRQKVSAPRARRRRPSRCRSAQRSGRMPPWTGSAHLQAAPVGRGWFHSVVASLACGMRHAACYGVQATRHSTPAAQAWLAKIRLVLSDTLHSPAVRVCRRPLRASSHSAAATPAMTS